MNQTRILVQRRRRKGHGLYTKIRLNGPKDGKARAENLTKEQSSEIARKAAKARWGKKRRDKESS